MSKKIYVATGNLKKENQNDLSKMLEKLPIEFSNYEISSGHIGSYELIKKIKEMKKDKKINFLLHNYPFREKENLMINLCEENEFKLEKIKKYIKRMINYTSCIGQDYFSFHGGFLDEKIDENSDLRKEKLMKFIKEVKEIVKYAETKKVKIGIENHVVTRQNLGRLIMNDIYDFKFLFQKIGSDNLFLHLDVGHLNVSSKTYNFSREEFVKEFKDKIYTIHIHDNNRIEDSHSEISEESYFLKYLKDMTRLEYIVLETWNQSTKNLEEMKKIILKKI